MAAQINSAITDWSELRTPPESQKTLILHLLEGRDCYGFSTTIRITFGGSRPESSVLLEVPGKIRPSEAMAAGSGDVRIVVHARTQLVVWVGPGAGPVTGSDLLKMDKLWVKLID